MVTSLAVARVVTSLAVDLLGVVPLRPESRLIRDSAARKDVLAGQAPVEEQLGDGARGVRHGALHGLGYQMLTGWEV